MAEQSRATITSTPANMAPRSDDPQQAPAEADWEKSQDDANLTSDTPPDLEKGSSSDEEAPAPAPAQKTDEFLVEFDGPNDPDNPKNWPPRRRWGITAAMGSMV